jgi:hypothetical protein
MSTDQDRVKHSRRLLKDNNAIKRQAKISKTSLGGIYAPPHQFGKRHSTNCGNPNCHRCGNPRKFYNEETIQETSHKQDKFWNDADS